MLSKRDEQMCAADKTRKRCHFFKSFFITKLFDEGNAATQGKYNYNNVKRWSKRVPGKDLFKLDKIFFPVNAGGVHWCCAVVFMAEKRIQFYDSLGGGGMTYLRGLFQYLKDEHKAKKGCPLPDEDKWELVTCTEDTPFQQNGMFCDDDFFNLMMLFGHGRDDLFVALMNASISYCCSHYVLDSSLHIHVLVIIVLCLCCSAKQCQRKISLHT
mmetsp:Transcript_63781/g.94737  ORF Transcript_63781/g.94737 Transcript_63781/m.94737 type:complete len:213 (-) Transcript_63781:408-1046(-)